MAIRQYRSEFLRSHNKDMVFIEGQFTIDSTQTSDTTNYKTTGLQGTGVSSVANIATGVYKISLTDNHFKLLGANFSNASVLGTQVAIASLSNGVPYVIKTLGTSAQADWVLAGMSADITAAVGVAFTAVTAASGSTGTGYAAPMITNGITKISVYGDPNKTINSASPTSTKPYLYVQTFYDAATDILAPAVPVDGTVIRFNLIFRDSGLLGSGE